jgi:hypothetical protein
MAVNVSAPVSKLVNRRKVGHLYFVLRVHSETLLRTLYPYWGLTTAGIGALSLLVVCRSS